MATRPRGFALVLVPVYFIRHSVSCYIYYIAMWSADCNLPIFQVQRSCYYASVAHSQRGIRIDRLVCLCVCLHACVDCYSCFMINEMKVRASLGIQSRFLDFNYTNASFSSYQYNQQVVHRISSAFARVFNYCTHVQPVLSLQGKATARN